MRRLYTYIVKHDAGLAPNPFWGWCTLAVCTPNYMGAKLAPGDWVAGFLGKDRGNRLLYAMEVSEILDMNDYFYDPRFQCKKPIRTKDWRVRAGDNFYSRNADGTWQQHWNPFHKSEKHFAKDTRYHRVYAGERFWYFGSDARQVEARFQPLIVKRGIKKNHPQELVRQFMAWIERRYEPGVHGEPNGRVEKAAGSKLNRLNK